jgi:NADH:ubiquinone oxidoreductase subunit 4 (subunit M)
METIKWLFYVGMFLAFWLGCLCFEFKLWLCRAHAEAPVSGSMILAGVLLHLGGYGLLYVFPILFKFGFGFSVILVVWSSVYIYEIHIGLHPQKLIYIFMQQRYVLHF